jgi:hypothetical protein
MLSLYQIFMTLNNFSEKEYLKELTMICYCITDILSIALLIQIEIDRELIK